MRAPAPRRTTRERGVRPPLAISARVRTPCVGSRRDRRRFTAQETILLPRRLERCAGLRETRQALSRDPAAVCVGLARVRAVPVLKLRETRHLPVHGRSVDPPVALARLTTRLTRLLEPRPQ